MDESKEWMDQVEDACFEVLLHCIRTRNQAEAALWAELMERLGLV